MNRIFAAAIIIMASALMAVAQAEPKSTTLTKDERKVAIEHLKRTEKEFLKSIAGLSEAQWKFKPSADKWSVAEVAEHIGISETTIFELVRKVMQSPAAPEKIIEVKGKDERVIRMIPDRSSKFQAPEMLRPVGRWATREALTKDFKTNRSNTIKYAAGTTENMRVHFLPHPVMKELDAYQWILLLSAHAERHTKQIEEVKADPNFPKK
ncbi:MAG: DinB family protein [Acidobacteria bacterium]|nr:DinB family protein [Acidobacteriota bacterium]